MTIIEPKFVNRKPELESLKNLAHQGSPSVLYIYGPEGCGKTRLLKEFIKRFNDIGIYIDALEKESPTKAITPSKSLKPAQTLITTLAEQVTGPIGKWLASKIFTLLDKIITKIELQDRHLVIIVDDITRALGLEEIELYIKWLYEAIHKIHEAHKPKTTLIIATTSEGYSFRRIARHTYNIINLIWNLDQKAYEELTKQLKPPNKETTDKTWKLTGGNPRRTIEIATIYNWNTDTWINQLKHVLRDTANIIKANNLTKETTQLIEDPDILDKNPTPKLRKAYELLLEHNLMMYTGTPPLTSWTQKDKTKWTPKPNPELGIGKYYSWQIPAYKEILKQLL